MKVSKQVPFIKLTDVQLQMVKIFKGLKSFARREAWSDQFHNKQFQHVSFDQVVNELVELNVIKRSKNGALTLNFDYEQANILIDLNEMPLEQAVANRQRATEALNNTIIRLEEMKNSGKYNKWPESEYLQNAYNEKRYDEGRLEHYKKLETLKRVYNW